MAEEITPTKNDSFIQGIEIKEKGKCISVNVSDIIWFEADTNYVKIHTNTTHVYLKKISLKELEQQLDPAFFVRIHRSTIVNFNSIESMFPYFKDEHILILKNGKALRISRVYKDKVQLICERSQIKSA